MTLTGRTKQSTAGGGPSTLVTDGSFSNIPAANPGETWAFQLWHRDGASSNFTNGVAIQFN